MSDIFDDENYFSESFTSFHYSEMCLFPQLELPLPETDSDDASRSSPSLSEQPISMDEVTSSESDAPAALSRPVSPSDSYATPPPSPLPAPSLLTALDSICSVKSWSCLSYQRQVTLAQNLSAVFQSRDLPDSDKFQLTRIILPNTALLEATDTLDIDLSRLTDERLQAIQGFLQRVSYDLVVGQRLPESQPHKTRGRPRSRHRVNHLKQKGKLQDRIGSLRRQNQKFFSREQVVSLTRDSEEELVDVLG